MGIRMFCDDFRSSVLCNERLFQTPAMLILNSDCSYNTGCLFHVNYRFSKCTNVSHVQKYLFSTQIQYLMGMRYSSRLHYSTNFVENYETISYEIVNISSVVVVLVIYTFHVNELLHLAVNFQPKLFFLVYSQVLLVKNILYQNKSILESIICQLLFTITYFQIRLESVFTVWKNEKLLSLT